MFSDLLGYPHYFSTLDMCHVKTVYLPRDFCKEPPGILLGTIDSDEDAIYVIAIVHLPITPEKLRLYLDSHHFHNRETKNIIPIHPLGVFYPMDSWESEDEDFCCLLPNLFAQDAWMSVAIHRTEQGNVAFKVEHQQKSESSSKDIFSNINFVKTQTDTILVLYRQKELWDGGIVDGAFLKVNEQGGSLERLYDTTQKCKEGILSYESGFNADDDDLKVTHCCVKRELSIVYFLFETLVKFILLMILGLLKIGHRIIAVLPSPVESLVRLCGKCVDYSSLLSHVLRRVVNFWTSLKRRLSSTSDQKKYLEDCDMVASVFADVLLGIVFLCILNKYDLLWSKRTTKKVVMPGVELIASQVCILRQ